MINIGKVLSAGMKRSTIRDGIVTVLQWVAGATLMGLGFDLFSRSSRPKNNQLMPDKGMSNPPPDQGGIESISGGETHQEGGA